MAAAGLVVLGVLFLRDQSARPSSWAAALTAVLIPDRSRLVKRARAVRAHPHRHQSHQPQLLLIGPSLLL